MPCLPSKLVPAMALGAFACGPLSGGLESRIATEGESVSYVQASNGQLLNGRSYNGRTWNGRTYNGRTYNGRTYNGRGWNGRGYNGRTYNGRTYNGASLTVSGSRLVLTESGAPLTDFGGGLELTMEFDDGSTLPIRIEGPTPADSGSNSDVFVYTLFYWDGARWAPMDADVSGNPIGAIPLVGLWDMREGAPPDPGTGEGGGGSWIDAPDEITFAVRGYALAKCVEIGYKPWVTRREYSGKLAPTTFQEPIGSWGESSWYIEGASGRYDYSAYWSAVLGSRAYENAHSGYVYSTYWSMFFEPDYQVLTLKSHHQACTRMIRADYCGDGRSHTLDGTRIDLWDNLDVQSRGDWPLESSWGVTGGSCVTHVRWESVDVTGDGSQTVGEYIAAHCPGVLDGSASGCLVDPGFASSSASFGAGCTTDPLTLLLSCSPIAWTPTSLRPLLMNNSETLVGTTFRASAISASSIRAATGYQHDLRITVSAENDIGGAVEGASVGIQILRDGLRVVDQQGTTDGNGRAVFTLPGPPSGDYTVSVVSMSDARGLVWDGTSETTSYAFRQLSGVRVSSISFLPSSQTMYVDVELATDLGDAIAPMEASIEFDLLRNGVVYKQGITGRAPAATPVGKLAKKGVYSVRMKQVSWSGFPWDGVTPPNAFTW